jgi:2-iminobutanoate/2-iminopropanoate deaminase
MDVATGEMAGHTVREQARQALLNCQAILRAAGAELGDAVMVHTLLLRPQDAVEEREQLVRWSRRATSAQALALRSRIVLGC